MCGGAVVAWGLGGGVVLVGLVAAAVFFGFGWLWDGGWGWLCGWGWCWDGGGLAVFVADPGEDLFAACVGVGAEVEFLADVVDEVEVVDVEADEAGGGGDAEEDGAADEGEAEDEVGHEPGEGGGGVAAEVVDDFGDLFEFFSHGRLLSGE